jgi:hypothetical protein
MAQMTSYPALGLERPHRRFARRLVLAGAIVVFLLLMGAAYSQKERYSDHVAELSRDLIGDENTARVESWYLSV